ncbi:MAG: lamin tail domain-containing protein [Flavobacteriales bacterium]|jgi:hypothetical protein|nr:lamin tail domain-containing protein [Flavobacteriales bacterium]
MKKLLLAASIVAFGLNANAQTSIFFSEYVEGSGQNKALEIFNGSGSSIDLGNYAVLYGYNGNGWTDTLTFPMGTTVADQDVYVIANSQATTDILNVADTTFSYNQSTVASFNGDDGRGLAIRTAPNTYTILDIIGNPNEDPGSAWDLANGNNATSNNTITRLSSITTGSLDTASWTAGTNAEWNIHPSNTFTFLGQHTMGVTTQPNINFQANNTVNKGYLASQLPSQETFAIDTANVPAGALMAAYIINPDLSKDTILPLSSTELELSVTMFGTYKMHAALVNPLNASIIKVDTLEFNANQLTIDTVADIAALRSGTIGDYYTLSGEALITYMNASRNQKYIQDATGAIVIDDPAGTITTSFDRYDGIKNLTGKLKEYGNFLQIEPTENITASSTGNTFTPEVITIADYRADEEAYEAECVTFEGAKFETTSTTFAEKKNYDLIQNGDTANFRLSFKNLDYKGWDIPTVKVNITLIPTQTFNFLNVTSRDSNDIELLNTSLEELGEEANLYPMPVRDELNVEFTSEKERRIVIYNALGAMVLNTKTYEMKTVIDVSALTPGMYTLVVSDKVTAKQQSIIIQ